MSVSSVSSEDIDLLEMDNISENQSHSLPMSPLVSSLKLSSDAEEDAGLERTKAEDDFGISINSFLPVLLQLPISALVFDNNAYYIYGIIEAEDRLKLCAYTRTIKELTLTGRPRVKNEPQIASESFLRLGQFQNPNQALFPGLKRLRIIEPNASLAHLFLCLTPSLKSLEVSHIPGGRSISLISFINALLKTCQLSELILGPGRMEDNLVKDFLQFANLRHLEMKDIILAIDYHFLDTLGTLSHLESLVLDAQTATYTCRALPPSSSYQSSAHDRIPQAGPFPRLRDLILSGSVLLIGDLIHYISSSTLDEVTLKFSMSENLTQVSWWANTTELQNAGNENTSDLVDTETGNSTSLGVRNLKKKKGATSSSAPVCSHSLNMDFNLKAILKILLTAGRTTLRSVVLHNTNTRSPDPLLPVTSLEDLVLHPNIVHLRLMGGWNLQSLDATLQKLSIAGRSMLQTLELPVTNTSSGVALTTLRLVAEHCRDLVRFQCRIATLGEDLMEKLRSEPPLSHPLQVLSVGNSTSFSSQQLILARYLYSLFPNLKIIETHTGQYDEQWEYVFELVKMIQSAKLTRQL